MPVRVIVWAGAPVPVFQPRRATVKVRGQVTGVGHGQVHAGRHLLGWDHEDEKEAVCMEQLEREILAAMGIEDPYGE